MTIFQIIQKPQLRGAEMFASQLSNNLEKMGHKIFLISVFSADAELPFVGEKIEFDRPLDKRFFDLKGWQLLAELIKEHRPDVIQANAADTLKFTVFSKLLYGWKTPIIYRNANKMGDFIKSRFQFILNKFLVSKTDFVISVSYECELDFKKTFKFPAQKIETVQIGVEHKEVGKFPADLSHIVKSGPLFVNVAGFVPEKNHKGLIRIFAEALKNYPNAQLLLIGKGKLEEEITEIVQKFDLAKHVHFLGRRNDVLEIIRASDLFLLPSLIEGLPAVILEAMYCSTPVVSYEVGGIGEVVKSGETGWLVKKNDEAVFVMAIKEALENVELSSSIQVNAKSMIHREFMNTDIAARFVEVYKAIAK